MSLDISEDMYLSCKCGLSDLIAVKSSLGYDECIEKCTV
jgi:hypothetical protein